MGQQAQTQSKEIAYNTNIKPTQEQVQVQVQVNTKRMVEPINNHKLMETISNNVMRARKGSVTSNGLKEGFKKSQIDGYLNKDRFNENIGSMLRFDIPIISNTYLAERLFDLLDDSRDGRIQESEYLEGMKNVFSSHEMRERLTFMAMMRKKEKSSMTLDFNDIFEYFFNSWLYGFRILADVIQKSKGELLQKNIMVVGKSDMESFAASQEGRIKAFLFDSIRESGIDPTQKIEFEAIRKWLAKDNTLQIIYANKGINIATSLLCLDEIAFTDDMGQYPMFK